MSQVLVKLNDAKISADTVEIEIPDDGFASLDDFIILICKQFKIKASKTLINNSKIYLQTGVELFKDDLIMLKNGDFVYFDPNGEPYNTSHILDQYQKLQLLGQGGFGSVFKARHNETG